MMRILLRHKWPALVTLGLLGSACTSTSESLDGDGDGYASLNDCNDSDAAIYPGAIELCDGIDNDCSGQTDGDDATDQSTWYLDTDGDGFGLQSSSTTACDQPTGYVSVAGDCLDDDATINEGVTEVCDGIDNDCDGAVDGDSVGSQQLWYQDADSDSFGNASVSVLACTPPSGYVSSTSDCDDSNAAISPNATEVCDNIDNNCDGTIDGGGSGGKQQFYLDSDGDGYGDASQTQDACLKPAGYVLDATDCDDSNAAISPASVESCNNLDDDCDGTTDDNDATNASTWYLDQDQDGYGTASTSTVSCTRPSGYAASAGDCNDSSSAAYPGKQESCDAQDNDCDGTTDEAGSTGESTWYLDQDSDGYGLGSSTTSACSLPAGYASTAGDCDDTQNSIYPFAQETCNSLDDDCDGSIDEAGATNTTTWYRDQDGDGYGTASTTTSTCTAPSGYVAIAGDCNDSSTAAYPGKTETCDDLDNDCDGSTDESGSTGETTFYQDSDGDGYGLSSVTMSACDLPTGYATLAGDCNDTNAAISPGDSEICDASNTDEDCDGLSDDSDASVDHSTYLTYYKDSDRDGYGVSSSTLTQCDKTSSYATQSGDCDDTSASRNPGKTEVCDNGIDENCSYHDADCTLYEDMDIESSNYLFYSSFYSSTSFGYTLLTPDLDGDTTPELVISVDETYSYLGYSSMLFPYDPSQWGSLNANENYTTLYTAGVFPRISTGGDFDGDGFDDMMMVDDNRQNYLYVLYGTSSYHEGEEYAADAADSTLSIPTTSTVDSGDFNADGIDDVLMSHGGKAGIFFGSSTRSSTLSSSSGYPYVSITGSGTSSSFCSFVSWVGDINGDGRQDFALTDSDDSTLASYGGAVYFFLGSTSWTNSSGKTTANAAAVLRVADADVSVKVVRPAGDVDGDGYDDVLISGYGAAYLLYGASSLSSSLRTDTNTTKISKPDDGSGAFGMYSVGGDFDGDGYADLFLADPYYNDPGTSSSDGGRISVFWGSSTRFGSSVDGDDADATLRGFGSTGNLGMCLRLTDFDDDGRSDLIASDTLTYAHGQDGAVYVLMGSGD